MLLKHASRTKFERMSLAITVLEMPTMMSIVKSLEPLTAINWNDARPWIAMFGAVILFLGWELRNKRREIQKLDLEIAQMRSEQSLVRVATIHEMNSLINDVERISARKLGLFRGPKSIRRLGIRFREFPVLRPPHFISCETYVIRNYGSLTVHELFPKLTKTFLKRHPCRVFSVGYE
jgi:hypothetical protein